MLLVFFVIFFFFNFYSKILKKLGECFGCFREVIINGQLVVDDDWNFLPDVDDELGEYWQCITGMEQKRWYLKEAYLQKDLATRTLDNTNFEKLRSTKRGKKFISNIPTYDILGNYRYADAFFYTPLAIRQENTTSDYVSKIIYMGEATTDPLEFGS